jgi:oxalate decarboxylase
MTHLFPLRSQVAQKQAAGASKKRASKTNFPVLQGVSLALLSLPSKCVREPHWHANADELGYCLKGALFISFYGSNGVREEFFVQAGEAFFIPSGFLHYIENIAEETAEIVLYFSHEEPEDFALSSTLGAFSNSVLASTWASKDQLFEGLPRSTQEVFAALNTHPFSLKEEAHYASSYRFNLEASSPLISTPFGSAKVARQNVWPILQKQALYSLEITNTGMREPHWHPETSELGFVKEGVGFMTILLPDGSLDSYEIKPGDVYFIPKAYPHHIENRGSSSLKIAIFFDLEMPKDIGLTASVRSFSNEALGSVMNVNPTFFKELPRYFEDLFLVGKSSISSEK